MREPKEPFLSLSEAYEKRSMDLGTESIWPPKRLRINEGYNVVLMLSKQPSSWQHAGRLCIYIIDGSIDPRLSPLDQIREEMPYMTRRQDARRGCGSDWNGEFTRARRSNFSTENALLFRRKAPKHFASLIEYNTTTRGTGSGYHTSNGLPLHFQKRPVEHFILSVVSTTPCLDMQTIAYLVARKQNVKLVTGPYA